MTQIPITDSVSAYQATNQTASLGTCPVGGGGWGESPITVANNASIGVPWGDCPWNDIGTPNTTNNGWDDPNSVNGNSHKTAMEYLGYGVPIFESDSANLPWMTESQSEGCSPTDESRPTKGTSDNKYDGLTKGDSNPRTIVIGNHEYQVPICKSNSESPLLTIQCRSEGPSPSDESQPTEETECGVGSVIAGTAVVAAALGGVFYGIAKMIENPGKNDNPTLAETHVPLEQPYSTAGLKQSLMRTKSAAINRLQETLGWENEDTSDNEDVQHPVYWDLPSVSQGDDEKATCMARPPIEYPTSVNTSHPGSNKPPNGRMRGRQSYIPPGGHCT